ncbi:hypothetical protein [Pseudoroseicyclus aestuarii]|uniref:Uncharacterized protein n=1 Tax=Pseudoroseicyclus aestuarii TaxID=1795041 RepID=A0A318SR07_9RHOB|nr:hypothetical protein [Pseudoroseicyclus aestuarii]PYE83845.1 hypothetical protein DFP88_103206 [Pseudoroseicyclus aestuarii]
MHAALSIVETSTSDAHPAAGRRQPVGLAEDLPPRERALLNRLRMAGLACRAAARADVFATCADLALDRKAGAAAALGALLRCLPAALDCRPVLYRPGATRMSRDEAWLMRAMICAAGGDEDSLRFLLRSRVLPQHVRELGFMIRRVTEGEAAGIAA